MEWIRITKLQELRLLISSTDVVLFDMDNTLVNTDNVNNLSYKSAIHQVLGQTYDDLFNECIRINRIDVKNKLYWISDEQFNEIISIKSTLYRKHIAQTLLIPEVANFLKSASSSNRCILVSNACSDRVNQTLDFYNLKEYFYAIITKEDCIDNKNKFTSAISKFKLNPDELWVFEDEQENIEKALELNVKHLILKDNENFYYLSK